MRGTFRGDERSSDEVLRDLKHDLLGLREKGPTEYCGARWSPGHVKYKNSTAIYYYADYEDKSNTLALLDVRRISQSSQQ